MGLTEKFSALRESAESQLDVLNSKEKTENALLLPFFDVLGYDAFNVREVEPGHVVELEGEARNVDYAVKIDGAPVMLFQYEEAAANLDVFDGEPLFQHFDALDPSLVVLTNGLTYRFFADLSGEGAVDGRPFLEFDLLDHEPEQISYLELLTKPEFDTEEVLSTAFELKYTRLLQNYLVRQREDPDPHFVRFLAAQTHEGEVSEEILERFHPVVQKFLRQFDVEERKVRRQATGYMEDAGQPTTPPEETTQLEASSLPNEEEGDVEAHPQEASSERSENGKQQEAAGSTDGEPEGEESENVKPEDGVPSNEGSEDGTNIAEEFANKVAGDS